MIFETNKIIKRLAFVLALFFICGAGISQQTYFQQEVNYTMQVRLDDEKNTLHATSSIEYINHSAQELTFIYFHLWPNAYKNTNTALGQQLLHEKKTTLFYSKPEERGYIDSLDFKVNGKPVKWEYDKDNIDICKVILNEPLKPQQAITITTPFFVKIPDAKFSRLGHSGQAYYITQWYPKPAVFDVNGWHAMPYLDQGEFYSEFGSFDVSITLPKNYLLASTGDRVNAEEEEEFLNRQVAKTMAKIDANGRKKKDLDFPPSSKETKTVRFKQNKVHDFAWFADKRFNVLHDQITLPNSGKVVNTWVFFTEMYFDKWKKAIEYVNASTLFYSKLNGDYPYNHVTAIDGTIMAGGGMEYPNITVIGEVSSDEDLDVVIAHEVGHNWFYGILGSNERDYPFMDEGINSFYEMRYVRQRYSTKKLSDYIGRDSTFKFLGINKTPFWKEKEIAFTLSLKSRTDQALNVAAPDYTGINYGTIVYSKMPVVLDYMMDYLGEEKFDKAMQSYFEEFKFKHPSPADLFKSLSASTGTDLSAFEKYLINSTAHVDYKIASVKRNKENGYDLKLKNRGEAVIPFNITAYKDGKPLQTIWFDGFEAKKKLSFASTNVDYFKIDGSDKMPDINRRNNIIKASGLFKKAKPLQFKFITHLENPHKTQVNYLPIAGFNAYNGFMLGAALHNYGFFPRQVEYIIAPMFGFKTKSPAGFAQINLNLYPKKVFQKIAMGVKAKSFAYNIFETKYLNQNNGTQFESLVFNYYKIAPYFSFDIKKKKANSLISQNFFFTSNIIVADSLNETFSVIKDLATRGPVKKSSTNLVNQLDYFLTNRRVINSYSLTVTLQQANSMAKVFGSFQSKINVSEKNFVDIRVFAGAFLSGTTNERGYYAFRPSGYNGYQDYLFEANFLGRNVGEGLAYHQYLEKDGNMKATTFIGRSPEWMLSLNLKSPKLLKLPLRVFADIITCDGRSLPKEKFLWDAGVNLTLWKDIVEVYVPLVYSNYIKNIYELNNIGFNNRIRFTFNIHKLAPGKFIQNALE